MNTGAFALVLHAHLPFVRHPEHERFLEETWLYEAILETYLPLLEQLEGWQRDGMKVRLALTLSPTLCEMLRDPLLQSRAARHLDALVELAGKEIHRTLWDRGYHPLAEFYRKRFEAMRALYHRCQGDLVGAFRRFQDEGLLEIITTAATHAVLPLFANHPPTLRAQVLTARDHYKSCFGRNPRGIWLPECAYSPEIEKVLQQADLRWFITDTHGLLHGRPRPRYGVFTPVYTPNGLAVFGRDLESARQVWSRHEGYPGDPRYRDFYRDIGYDLDLDYVRPCLAAPERRGFTGIKYHRITGGGREKEIYQREAALRAADDHASHFLARRLEQFIHLGRIMDRPPLLVSPYDAELFGHWWYEGPEFLNLFVRKAYYDQTAFRLVTPGDYLDQNATLQVIEPSPSSWGEEGYLRVWLNESNAWMYPHLHIAQQRMTALVRRFTPRATTPLQERALKQAARELLLAQSSDWPFILRTGTSPDYARRRFEDHVARFQQLHDHLKANRIPEDELSQIEAVDNLFPEVNPWYWS